MPGTHTQLLLHVVFSTKHRESWIAPEIADRLYPFIGGIIRDEKGVLYDIGGVADHLHFFLRWRPDESLSNLMRHIKSRSSRWIHETFPSLRAFAWQEGYSAFTVSKSQENAIKKYIAGQEEHHKKEDFKTELRRFIAAHQIEYDERYLFDLVLNRKPVRPSGAKPLFIASTGDARLGAALRHPWLHSRAPPGPRRDKRAC